MPWARIPFILSTALASHVAVTAPNSPPNQCEQVTPIGMELVFAKTIPWLPTLFKEIHWLLALAEVAVILDQTSIMEILSLDPNRDCRLTSLFIFGWSLAVIGAALRVTSYRALGVLFTFELSIRVEHKLVTSGPYAYVRHPSYTGIFMVIFGCIICHLHEGALLRECLTSAMVDWQAMWSMLVALGVVGGVFTSVAIMARMEKEDAMLRDAFGREWEDWSRQVPARLIPFVY